MLTSKLEAAQQGIQRRYDPHFAWVINESAPWALLTKPLSQCTVALVTTCGLYRLDTQTPFDAWNNLGDPSFREIHADTVTDRLGIAHTHYDRTQLAADFQVALPVAHFYELAKQACIGRLHPWTYSFMGYLPEPRQLVRETAPEVARGLRTGGVDAAFLTPC